MAFIRSNGLSRYFLYSALLGLAVLLLVGLIVTLTFSKISALLYGWIPYEIGWLGTVTDIFSIAVMSISFFLVFKYLMLIVTAPVMSVLSAKVERILDASGDADRIESNFLKEMIRGIRINLRNVIRELGLTVLILLASLIPAVAIITTPALFLVQSYYAGFGNYDFWAERHFTYRGTIDFIGDHRPMVTGNGIVYVLLLAIPIVGVILAPPLATVASTLHGREVMEELESGNDNW